VIQAKNVSLVYYKIQSYFFNIFLFLREGVHYKLCIEKCQKQRLFPYRSKNAAPVMVQRIFLCQLS